MENLKTFAVESIGQSGINATWINRLQDKPCEDLLMSIPPEFEGPGGTYSPEDLYALSLMNCYLATFKYIAEKSKLKYEKIKGEALLRVAKGNEKSLWMEKVEITITLTGCETKDRAQALLEKTKSHCMIINSVKTEADFNFFII
jgi:organic hydroperoxide reductase OsmC/OhrA